MPTRHQVGSAAVQLISTAAARRATSYPSAPMARDGFVVRAGYVSSDEAAAMLRDVERFTDRTVKRTGVEGTKLRDRADRQQRDLHVRQITGAQHLSPAIAALGDSGRIDRELSALTGRPLRVGGITVQVDWPDTETKRGLHVDSHWPPTYKAFVYLTPVLGPENGPFTVVPGSHRHRLRKLRAIAGDYAGHRDRTDMDHEYRVDEARALLGGPGTAIFADQRLAHGGSLEHVSGTRVMLVVYLYDADVVPPSFLGGAARQSLNK